MQKWELSDYQWEQMKQFFPPKEEDSPVKFMQQQTKTEKQCVFSQHVEIYDSTQAEKLLHDTIHESL